MPATKPKPNVILINCDDLGYGDLGCYGSPVHQTPVLDKMAREGIRFTDFYMASAVCSPSRAAMMTGSYPKRVGFGNLEGRAVLFPGQGVGLHPSEHTVAKALKQEGYATMLVGKWHCGDQPEFLPTKHGFDHYYGLPYSNDMGRQVGREHMPPLPLMLDDQVLEEQPEQSAITERYVEQSVRFIRNNQDRPFFLYLAHMYVHLPLYVPERFLRESANGAYGAAVACIDWVAGVLLAELKKLGLDENTLIIFTSDNGSRNDTGFSSGPLRGTKFTTWEGGLRVPCIMYWPGTIPAGQVSRELVTSMDFLPTLTRLAGGELPADRIVDGHDILPLMLGEEGARSSREVFYYYRMNNLEAIRSGQWKLHVRKQKEEVRELYDLDNDIGEATNVYAEHPDVVARLEQLAERARDDLGDDATDRPGSNCRPVGKVEHPDTLTHYDENHPYIIAMYDLKDAG